MSRSALGVTDIREVCVYIYALCEPTTGEVRYVGKSRSPHLRLGQHRSRTAAAPVRKWLGSMSERPGLVILQTVPAGADASAAELDWIRRFRDTGSKLLNAKYAAELSDDELGLSAGARALRAFIRDRFDGSISRFSESSGIDRVQLTKIVSGKSGRRMSVAFAFKLERATAGAVSGLLWATPKRSAA